MIGRGRTTSSWLSIAPIALVLLSPAVQASNPGEPGRLLEFGAGARSLAMGTAYTAIAQDATASYWNPAGLAAVRRNEVNVLHTALYGGATYDYLGYGGFHAGDGVLGGHLARLAISGADLRDSNNNLLGSFGYSETDLGLGYGMVLPMLPTLGLGVSGNVLSRSMPGSSDRLMGLDFGSQYALSHKLGMGLVFKNALRMAQGDTEDKLPQQIRFGAGYQPVKGLTLSTDLENFSQFYLGAEYAWDIIALRAGVQESNPTYGLGLHWKDLRVDFAMTNTPDLGASQRISLSYAFGKLKGSESDYNPELSSDKFVEQGQAAIGRGFYSQAQQLYQSARRVNPKDHEIRDKLDRLAVITPYVHSVTGWDRPDKTARQGLNDFLAGKSIDGLWRLTYAYSLDKGQTGLLRVAEAISRLSNYRVDLYDASSSLTLAQQVLAQALVDFRAQHYDDAANLCQRVVSLEPNNALAYKRLGSALYALHQFDAAKEAWQKAMAYETDAAAKAQLKGFIDMARAAAMGLPPHMPGDAADHSEEIDLESTIAQQ